MFNFNDLTCRRIRVSVGCCIVSIVVALLQTLSASIVYFPRGSQVFLLYHYSENYASYGSRSHPDGDHDFVTAILISLKTHPISINQWQLRDDIQHRAEPGPRGTAEAQAACSSYGCSKRNSLWSQENFISPASYSKFITSRGQSASCG